MAMSESSQSIVTAFLRRKEESEVIDTWEVQSGVEFPGDKFGGTISPEAIRATRFSKSFAAFSEAKTRGDGGGCGSLSFGKLSGITCECS